MHNREIELTRGYKAIVSDEDYDLVSKHKWCYHSDGYAHSRIKWNGKHRMILMHRLILDIVDTPELHVDHKDMDGLNNTRDNIRACTRSQNFANQRSYKGSKCKYKGVFKRMNYDKWRARLRLNGKQIHLGDYSTPEEAAIAYNKGALKYFGEFARLNEVEI